MHLCTLISANILPWPFDREAIESLVQETNAALVTVLLITRPKQETSKSTCFRNVIINRCSICIHHIVFSKSQYQNQVLETASTESSTFSRRAVPPIVHFLSSVHAFVPCLSLVCMLLYLGKNLCKHHHSTVFIWKSLLSRALRSLFCVFSH